MKQYTVYFREPVAHTYKEERFDKETREWEVHGLVRRHGGIAMDTKLTVKQIEEMLVEHEGGARKNICVPNVSFSMLNHEADLIIVNRSHYATEFEIKRSYHDFVADFAKKHRHEAEWVYKFVYVLPLSIKDKAMKFLEDTGRKDSVCVWFYSEEPWITERVGIPHNPRGRKMYLEELLKLARLGVMRYWSLRERLKEPKTD